MKHTPEDIRHEFDRLDRLCGVDTSAVGLKISTRASKRLGSCRCSASTVESITISDFVLDADDKVFFDTIRHEYAHALVKLRRPKERHGHDALWREACLEVGCAPSRCCDPAELPILPLRRAEPDRYSLRCLGCGAFWRYKRKTKVLTLVERGSRRCTCPHCKGHRFELAYLQPT